MTVPSVAGFPLLSGLISSDKVTIVNSVALSSLHLIFFFFFLAQYSTTCNVNLSSLSVMLQRCLVGYYIEKPGHIFPLVHVLN